MLAFWALVTVVCCFFLAGNADAATAPTRGNDSFGVDNPSMLTGDQTGHDRLLRGALTSMRGQEHNDSAVVLQYLARHGDSAAQHFLGTLYLNGWGVEQSISKAYTWFAYSAHQGLPASEYRLGLAFFRAGKVDDAVSWWERAAQHAHLPAQYNLGLLYLYGMGVTTDYDRAASLLENAAERGSPGAQFYLGMMYLKGQGYEQDRTVAEKWLNKSAQSGFSLTSEDVDNLKQGFIMPLFAR